MEIEKIVKDLGYGSIDEKFFDLTAKTLDNKEIKFSDYKGKVLVIDFWASWCPPCVMEIPHFIELQKEYNDSNVQIIGISKDNSSATVKEFIKRTNINYPVIMDMPELSDFFGSITSIPTTFILDKNANIIEKAVGYRDKSFFEKEIEQLL
ncbi:MAG: TlpA family protein disulfide reductase [bacterium]|nr:TlpA family protein disulfide reductase [bacterium]